jgi:hypothetical protein
MNITIAKLLHHQILPQVVVKLIVNWENTVNEWNIIFQQVVGKLQNRLSE